MADSPAHDRAETEPEAGTEAPDLPIHLPVRGRISASLPTQFHQKIRPLPVPRPRLALWNDRLAAALGIDRADNPPDGLAQIFSGNRLLPGSEPVALAYAGHQFGHFVPRLGDGRAHLLGEWQDRAGRWYDVQLKGSGRTRFSRGGDGRAALGPMLREYLVSEGMHGLGIPTTRALALVTTGEPVFRETVLEGAILTRVAASHVRVGTFEYFAAHRDPDALRILCDFVIDRHYPHVRDAGSPIVALLGAAVQAQAQLVAQWMAVGFVHGVMNTDNMTLSGETIDYGPCAFLDAYGGGVRFSSIDTGGRYAFGNQPAAAHWNLSCLASCLVGVSPQQDQPGITGQLQEALDRFPELFRQAWLERYLAKLGLHAGAFPDPQTASALVEALLEQLEKAEADFTVFFRLLADSLDGQEPELRRALEPRDWMRLDPGEDSPGPLSDWWAGWRARLEEHGADPHSTARAMRQVNPLWIARNHRIEQLIAEVSASGDFRPVEAWAALWASPWQFPDDPARHELARAALQPPQPGERVHATFCGT